MLIKTASIKTLTLVGLILLLVSYQLQTFCAWAYTTYSIEWINFLVDNLPLWFQVFLLIVCGFVPWLLGACFLFVAATKSRNMFRNGILAVVITLGFLFFSPFGYTIFLEKYFRPQAKLPCAANLRQIGIALSKYANEHRGEFPASEEKFMQLYPLYIKSARTFWCLYDYNNETPPKTIDNFVPDAPNSSQISFTYFPGHRMGEKDAIILQDNSPLNHGGRGVYVLYGDFHVEWKPVEKKE